MLRKKINKVTGWFSKECSQLFPFLLEVSQHRARRQVPAFGVVVAALEAVAVVQHEAEPGVVYGVVQAALNAVVDAGGVGKEVGNPGVGDGAGRAFLLQLCQDILQLVEVVPGVSHGQFQFLHIRLLDDVVFFFVSYY